MNRPQGPVQLSVNVDHVATLRQARGTEYPDPLAAARIAEAAGATGITVHLRSDRRHIQDRDVERIAAGIEGKLNLEMANTEEMLAIAERVGPHQVTLVPERPDEVTTEGGLDLLRKGSEIAAATARLQQAGIAVSLFLDPEPEQIACTGAFPSGALTGYEINTDAYTRASAELREAELAKREAELARREAELARREAELAKVKAAASLGPGLGLAVYAGHGLTTSNVGAIAALPEIEELNIGHWLVSRSVTEGMHAAVQEMLAAIAR